MSTRMRRGLGALLASATLAAAGLSAVAVTPVSALTVAGCVSQGSMTITPGFTPIPQAESISFAGTMTCAGVVGGGAEVLAPGSFTGSMGGCTGSIEVSLCTNLSESGPGYNCSAGIALWWGYYHEWHCVIGPIAYWHWGAWLPNPLNQGTDITTITFEGVDTPVAS